MVAKSLRNKNNKKEKGFYDFTSKKIFIFFILLAREKCG